jgi:hypothetical protein
MSDNLEKLRRARCGACKGRVGRGLNLVMMGFQAAWNYPTAGNVLTGEAGAAVAVLCDACCNAGVDAIEVIELAGDQLLYHPVPAEGG